jgi:hypothetical protein
VPSGIAELVVIVSVGGAVWMVKENSRDTLTPVESVTCTVKE